MWVIPDFIKQKDFKQNFFSVNKDRSGAEVVLPEKGIYRICNKNEKSQSMAFKKF